MGTAAPRTFTTRTGDTVRVRTASPDDAAAIASIARHTASTSEFAVTQIDEIEAGDEKTRERIREHLESSGSLYLVAETGGVAGMGGEIVGELDFRARPRRRVAHHGHFGIAIVQPWQGRGVGRGLITTLLDWARDHPAIEKVCLGVLATNHRAVALYTSMGFVQECRRIGEFKLGPGLYVDDIQMAQYVKPTGLTLPPLIHAATAQPPRHATASPGDTP